MRKKPILIQTNCKRCGKPLITTNKSFYGADEAKAKYGSLCSDCATIDELWEINKAIGEKIIGV